MLTLYRPECEDLWFREQMLSDAETMAYNHAWGGTIPFPKEQWKDWHDHWVVNPDGKRYYRYVMNETGDFIGEIAYHYDAEINGHIANVIVYAEYRGRGYGSLALDALCSAAKENGIPVLYDDIAIDNPAVDMFLRHGFSEAYRTKEKIVLKKIVAQIPGGMHDEEDVTATVTLRKFELSDSELISSRLNLPIEKANSLIHEWNAGFRHGSFFEMFAVQCDGAVVGTISLYGHSETIVSIGPEIFEEFRRRGFAKAAMTEAIRIAKEKGYEIVLQQVRTDNGASIRLHEASGFEKDNCTYRNKNGNEVYLYLKAIR